MNVVWILLGIYVSNAQFHFRMLEIHDSEQGCLMASEAVVAYVGREKLNYNVVCIKTDQIKGTAF